MYIKLYIQQSNLDFSVQTNKPVLCFTEQADQSPVLMDANFLSRRKAFRRSETKGGIV